MAVARSRIVFHPGVADDLTAIIGHYAELDSGIPPRFRARLREQLEHLIRFPASGAPLFDDVRRVVIRRFPYLLAYRITGDQIQVLPVTSFRRDPQWIQRLAERRSTDPS